MAGSSVIGALRVTLGLDSAAFTEGLGAAQKTLNRAGKNLQKTGESIRGVGQALSIGITAPFAALVASAIPAATESAQALAQVEAAQKSMGGASKLTTAQLQDMAGALQHMSLFDDDDILKSVTANMLTFGNISGDAFRQANEAAVNLSARLGQDLQSSAIQVGKALNDPVKGVNALRRVGVQFTDQQKEQIKAMVEAGDTAGAQAIILKELANEFGGAAKAQRDATPNADLQEKWRTFQEVIGGIAIKVLPPLTDFLTRLLNGFNNLSPQMQSTIVAGAAIAAALGPVILVIGSLVSTLGVLLPLAVKLAPAIKLIGDAFTMARVVAMAFLPGLLPILPVLAAVAGAAALVYAAYKYWPEITAFVSGVYTAVKTWLIDKVVPYLQYIPGPIGLIALAFKNWDKISAWIQAVYTGVKTWLVDKLTAVWDSVKTKIDAVKGWFFGLYDAVVGHSYIPDMVDGIATHVARLDGVMVKPIQAATNASSEAFKALRDSAQGLLDRLFPEQAAIDKLKSEFALLDKALADKLISPAVYSAARDRLNAELQTLLDEAQKKIGLLQDDLPRDTAVDDKLQDDILKFAGRFPTDFGDPVQQTTQAVAESFRTMADTANGAIRSVSQAIKSGNFFDILGSVLGAIGQIAGLFKGGAGIGGIFTSLGGLFGGFGGGGGFPGFATGGSFKVGGVSGIDQNLVSFKATRGEIVDIRRPGNDNRGGGGGNTYHVSGNLLTPEFWAQIQAMDEAAAAQGASGALSSFSKARARSLR